MDARWIFLLAPGVTRHTHSDMLYKITKGQTIYRNWSRMHQGFGKGFLFKIWEAYHRRKMYSWGSPSQKKQTWRCMNDDGSAFSYRNCNWHESYDDKSNNWDWLWHHKRSSWWNRGYHYESLISPIKGIVRLKYLLVIPPYQIKPFRIITTWWPRRLCNSACLSNIQQIW